jgi:hypothetical protein
MQDRAAGVQLRARAVEGLRRVRIVRVHRGRIALPAPAAAAERRCKDADMYVVHGRKLELPGRALSPVGWPEGHPTRIPRPRRANIGRIDKSNGSVTTAWTVTTSLNLVPPLKGFAAWEEDFYLFVPQPSGAVVLRPDERSIYRRGRSHRCERACLGRIEVRAASVIEALTPTTRAFGGKFFRRL